MQPPVRAVFALLLWVCLSTIPFFKLPDSSPLWKKCSIEVRDVCTTAA